MTLDRDGDCASLGSGSNPISNPMREFIINDDAQSEIRMFDLPATDNNIEVVEAIWAFNEAKSDVFKTCLTGSDACVTSFVGYSSIDDIERRERLADRVEQYLAGDLPLGASIGAVFAVILSGSSYDRQASTELAGVDVSFKMQSFTANPRIPERVLFNTCLDDTDSLNSDPDLGYKAYHTAVHEAGHALGLSNMDYPPLVNIVFDSESWPSVDQWPIGQEYHAAHPTIPDSAMNYDDKNPPVIKHPAVGSGFAEPDCSPHPFDVMALYSIYQGVSLAGSGNAEDEG